MSESARCNRFVTSKESAPIGAAADISGTFDIPFIVFEVSFSFSKTKTHFFVL